MAKVMKQVEVSKEADALFGAVVALVKGVKDALKDGFNVQQDMVPIVTEAFKDLPVIVANMQNLGPDLAEDRAAFLRAASLAGDDLVDLFLAAQSAPAPAEAPKSGAV